jgi:hypothetical protein
VGVTLEASKLLVPGPDSTGNVPNVGVIEGIGKSFSNKESIMYSGSVEYSYDNAFAVRTGFFRETERSKRTIEAQSQHLPKADTRDWRGHNRLAAHQ